MYTGSILIGLALLILTVPFLAGPLLKEKRASSPWGSPPVKVRQEPGAHQEQVLLALRDLDFDHKTGKVTEEDYARLRAALLAEAAVAVETSDRDRAKLEAEIEAEVKARRSRQKSSDSSDGVRAGAYFCSQCGTRLRPGDRFCSNCGARVKGGL